MAIVIRLRPNLSPNSSPLNSSSSTSSSPSTSDTAPLPPQNLLPSSPPTSPLIESSNNSNTFNPPPVKSVTKQLEEFFNLDWVKHEGTVAELLYIKRAIRDTDKWSGHIAFSGGRQEADDGS